MTPNKQQQRKKTERKKFKRVEFWFKNETLKLHISRTQIYLKFSFPCFNSPNCICGVFAYLTFHNDSSEKRNVKSQTLKESFSTNANRVFHKNEIAEQFKTTQP